MKKLYLLGMVLFLIFLNSATCCQLNNKIDSQNPVTNLENEINNLISISEKIYPEMSEDQISNAVKRDVWNQEHQIHISDVQEMHVENLGLTIITKSIIIISGGTDGLISFDYTNKGIPAFVEGNDDIKCTIMIIDDDIEHIRLYYDPKLYGNIKACKLQLIEKGEKIAFGPPANCAISID